MQKAVAVEDRVAIRIRKRFMSDCSFASSVAMR